jgi:hypothetical protein
MIALLLNPLVLLVLVWLVARDSAEIDFGRMFFIALGVGLAGFAVGMVVDDGYLALLATLPVLGLLVFLLMKYCGVTLQQALVVTGLYFAYQIGFAVLMESLLK